MAPLFNFKLFEFSICRVWVCGFGCAGLGVRVGCTVYLYGVRIGVYGCVRCMYGAFIYFLSKHTKRSIHQVAV